MPETPPLPGPDPVRLARLAGLLYLGIIGLGLAQQLLVAGPVPGSGAPGAAADAMAGGELLHRVGILADVLLYALVLILSAVLFLLLRGVSGPVALAALVLRCAEAMAGVAVTLVGGLVPLLLLGGGTPEDGEQARILAMALAELRTGGGLDVVLVLVGLGGALYSTLFYTSRCVPPVLAAWGILTYLSILVLGSLRLLLPGFPAPVTEALFAHGALFEILFGAWLLVKGVDRSRLQAPGGPPPNPSPQPRTKQ